MDSETANPGSPYARHVVLSDGLPPPYGNSLVQAFVPARDQGQLADRLRSLPAVALTAPEMLDLELIASGALSPLAGFMTSAVYDSVLRASALPNGLPWGLPVTLAVTREVAARIRIGDEAALWFANQAVGIMQIQDIFAWEPEFESRLLGPLQSDTHLAERRAQSRTCLVGGPVALLAARGATYMQTTHVWPLELRSQFVRHAWRQVSVPHVYAPWRRPDEYLLKCALEASDALLLHVPAHPESVGGGIPWAVQASASQMLVDGYFPADRVFGNPVPANLLSPTPRAALMHAIVSQNYGASSLHIPDTVRRDGSRELFDEASRHGLLIRPAFVPAVFHCQPCGGLASHKSCPHEVGRRIEFSDAQLADQLRNGEALSPLVARPEIARFLAREMAGSAGTVEDGKTTRHLHPHHSEVGRELRESLAGHRAGVLWMTGLSGSGKSTIAHRVERDLLLAGHRVFVLDGDTLRHGLNHDLGFSEGDRRENLRRAAEVAKIMVDAGLIVIASFISPFRSEREMVREIVGPTFFEVHIDASLEACEQRDPKGLYRRARAGQIEQFTGISSPYEPPDSPDLRLDTVSDSIENAVQRFHAFLVDRGVTPGRRSGRLASLPSATLAPVRVQ